MTLQQLASTFDRVPVLVFHLATRGSSVEYFYMPIAIKNLNSPYPYVVQAIKEFKIVEQSLILSI